MAFHKTISAPSLPWRYIHTPRVSPCLFVVKQDKLSNLTFFSLTYPVRSRYYTFQIRSMHIITQNMKYKTSEINIYLIITNHGLLERFFYIRRQFSTNLPLVCVAITGQRIPLTQCAFSQLSLVGFFTRMSHTKVVLNLYHWKAMDITF